MKKTTLSIALTLVIVANFTIISTSYAQPYGVGLYNENIPYGSQTALTISTDAVEGSVAIPTITPTEGGSLGTVDNTVTITSTDVIGYKLYIRALDSTDMNNLGTPLPASSNIYENPATTPLDVNTWGYNVNGSVINFCGMTLIDQLIRSTTVPVSGENTIITYGMKIDMAKPAGNYSVGVVYTAVPQTN